MTRLNETYLRGQEVRSMMMIGVSKYLIHTYDEREQQILGVWDSEAEMIVQRIATLAEEEIEEVVAVDGEGGDHQLFLIKHEAAMSLLVYDEGSSEKHKIVRLREYAG